MNFALRQASRNELHPRPFRDPLRYQVDRKDEP